MSTTFTSIWPIIRTKTNRDSHGEVTSMSLHRSTYYPTTFTARQEKIRQEKRTISKQPEKGRYSSQNNRVHASKAYRRNFSPRPSAVFDMVQYYVFPKIFGLVERGWNAYPEWSPVPNDDKQALYERLGPFTTPR